MPGVGRTPAIHAGMAKFSGVDFLIATSTGCNFCCLHGVHLHIAGWVDVLLYCFVAQYSFCLPVQQQSCEVACIAWSPMVVAC